MGTRIIVTEKKYKFAAWLVSNCATGLFLSFLSIFFFNIIICTYHTVYLFFFTESDREDYVKELGKYFPVHIYGRCGKLSCPENDAG